MLQLCMYYVLISNSRSYFKWQEFSMFVLVRFISKLLDFFFWLNTALGAWTELLRGINLNHIFCASSLIHPEAHWNYQQAHSVATLKIVQHCKCETIQLNSWRILVSYFKWKCLMGGTIIFTIYFQIRIRRPRKYFAHILRKLIGL